MEFELKKIQVGFFLATIDTSSKLNIASAVSSSAREYLNIDPVLLPFPPDSPPEFPLIIIKNDATGWNFQLSPSRFDIVFSPVEKIKTNFEKSIELIETVSSNIFNVLSENFGARVNRLGIVANNSSNINNATDYLQNKYLITKLSDGASETRLSYIHKHEISPFEVNEWIRVVAKNSPAEFILEIDINTKGELPILVDNEILHKFFTISRNQIINNIVEFSK